MYSGGLFSIGQRPVYKRVKKCTLVAKILRAKEKLKLKLNDVGGRRREGVLD